jgi:hypothetical protein
VRVSDGRAVGLGFAALGGVTVLLLLLFAEPDGRRAVLVSAAVALVVQGICYVVVRNAPPRKLLVAWAATAVLRLLSLVMYALVIVAPLKLPAIAALVSLATLFFVTTVLESLLFKS